MHLTITTQQTILEVSQFWIAICMTGMPLVMQRLQLNMNVALKFRDFYFQYLFFVAKDIGTL